MDTLPDRPRGAPLSKQVEDLKPRAGCIFLVIPIIGVIGTFAAYAWLIYNGVIGRPASGPQVEITFAGCPDAAEIVSDRLDDMGLGRPEIRPTATGFSLVTTLPTPETDPGQLAAVLAATGKFQMRDGDEVLADETGIDHASVRLDLGIAPSTLVVLQPAHRDRVYARMGEKPDAKTSMWIDGIEVWSFGNRRPSSNGEFEIPPSAENDQARMELAAGRGIALNNGPLPCSLTVSEVASVILAPEAP